MKRVYYVQKLTALMLAFAMTLAMAVPAFAATNTEDRVFQRHRDYLLSHTTAALCKLPTDLEPTPTAENLNLDPLSYWNEIIPVRIGFCGGVQTTQRPSEELYQELRQLVTELTMDKTTVADKYTAIHYWVEDNISYSTDNRTDNAYTVYERGYGACAEMANLRYLMATLAGIKAAVLYSPNHMSTAAMDENGKWFGDEHEANSLAIPAKRAYYTDGPDQYCCDLETGEIAKLRTFADKTIKVRQPKESMPHAAFDDVPADTWYADAVDWAVAKGIVNGTSETTFSPLEPCTEAQIITMMYRAEGSPDCSDVEPKLRHIHLNSWAAEAIKWSDSKGLFPGSWFDENEGCTRISAVYHIWRAFDGERIKTEFAFTDLNVRVFQKYAANWAVKEGIVNGTSETTFSPDLICNRATVVTMLYRAYGME